MSDNIWIQQIRLKNFQKHADLTIDFKSGINIIHGETEAGKSCIRRAIEWVTENKSIDGVRKVGTKETSVFLLFSTGIGIEKVRSASINRYIIHKEGKETKFDAVGKSIPEEVKNEIGIIPIDIDGEEIYLNATPQLGLPFLFDKSPSKRMKLFNKLTGNDLLDKLFVDLNKDILRFNRDLKETKLSLEAQVSAVAEKEITKEKLEAKYKKMKTEIEELEKLVSQCNTFSELLKTQQDIENNLNKINDLILSIKIPEAIDIKEVASKIEVLIGLKSLQDAFQALQELSKVNGQLKDLTVPDPQILEDLLAKMTILDKLKELCYTYNTNEEQIEAVDKKLNLTLIELDSFKTELNDLLKEMKICIVCGQEISEEVIKSCTKNV